MGQPGGESRQLRLVRHGALPPSRRRGRFRPWLAALHLHSPPAFLEVGGRFLTSGVANLNAVVDGDGAGRLGEACCRAFVLNDVGVAFKGRDSALHVDLELVGVDLRPRESGANRGFELRVRQLRGGLRRGVPLMRGQRTRIGGVQQAREQEKGKTSHIRTVRSHRQCSQ